MKKIKRIIASSIIFTSLLAINPVAAYETGHKVGTLAVGWVQINAKWYYFNQSGAMQRGWVTTNNKWYFLGSDGALYINCMTPDGYKVDGTGAWVQ